MARRRTPTPRPLPRPLPRLLCAAALLAPLTTPAVTYTWLGGGQPTPSSWINPLNWQGLQRPFSADDATLVFANSFVLANNDVQADFHLNRLRAFDNGGVGGSGTLLGQSLRFAGSGAEVFVGNNGSLVLNNALLGSTAWSKAGAGTLTLGGDNSASSSAVSVAAGRLVASGLNALGQGAVSVAAGATLRTEGAQTLAGLSGAGSWEATGSSFLALASGQRTFSGSVSGGGALFKSGAGTQTFAGNTTLGAVTVSAGALEASGNGRTLASGNLVVGNGGAARSGAGALWNVGGALGLGTGTVGVDGAGSRLAVSGQLTVGEVGGGSTLSVANGGRLDTVVTTIGAGVLASGVVDVAGSGSSWFNTGTPVVGASGFGTASLRDGGLADSGGLLVGQMAGSVGEVRLSGGASWDTHAGILTLGQGGRGEMTVASGAVMNNGSAVLGSLAGSSGQATVDGGTWHAGSGLTLGVLGTGTLAITGGGIVNAGNVAVGSFAAGTLALSGSQPGIRSQLNASGVLSVGVGGSGTVTLGDGAQLTSHSAVLGIELGSNGTVTLQGSHSPANWASGALDIGKAGTGSLSIAGNASVSSADVRLGVADSAVGTATVSAGAYWSTGALQVGADGEGRLSVQQGGRVDASSVQVGTSSFYSAGEITVDGMNGSLASLLRVSGALSVGTAATENSRIDHPQYLSISGGGMVEVVGALTVRSTGRLRLQEGLLRVGTMSVLGDGQFNWLGGELQITDTGGASLGSGVLPQVLALTGNKVLTVNQRLNLGSGTIALADNAQVRAATLALAGGQIVGSALNLGLSSALTGHGSVTSPVFSTRPDNLIRAAGGPLALGSLNQADGFAFAGRIEVEDGRLLVLHSANTALLGHTTVLGHSARLQSLNGLRLAAGGTLGAAGPATVLGHFDNQGQVIGPAGSDWLVFNDDVGGAGNFGGNVRFNQGYSPGDGAATVMLDAVAFAASAELLMELEAGGQDRLLITGQAALDGTLHLDFADGFAPAAGSSFVLADWAGAGGQFSSVTVEGLAPEMSVQLSYEAHALRLTVSAVPEPGQWALLLAGGACVAALARRRRPAR